MSAMRVKLAPALDSMRERLNMTDNPLISKAVKAHSTNVGKTGLDFDQNQEITRA
jgi:hypothetical protein